MYFNQITKCSNQIISENNPYNLCLCTFTLLHLKMYNEYSLKKKDIQTTKKEYAVELIYV